MSNTSKSDANGNTAKGKLTRRDWKIVFVATLNHLNAQNPRDFGSKEHYEKHKREIRKIVDYARQQTGS